MRHSLLPLAFMFAAPLASAEAQRSTPVRVASAAEARAYRSLEDSLLAIPASRARAIAARRAADFGDRADLLTVMRVARTIPSSTDRAGLLDAVAPRYLTGTDDALATAWMRVARTIPSSDERRDLMVDIMPLVAASPSRVIAVLETVRAIPSSTDRASVLIAMVEAGAVRTDAVRTEFAEVLMKIPSEHDRKRVARAAQRAVGGE